MGWKSHLENLDGSSDVGETLWGGARTSGVRDIRRLLLPENRGPLFSVKLLSLFSLTQSVQFVFCNRTIPADKMSTTDQGPVVKNGGSETQSADAESQNGKHSFRKSET